MNDLNNRTTQKDHHSTIEGAAFWQSHIDHYQKTPLSRKAYCREERLDYNRFQYWFHKLKVKPATRFPKAIPIRVKDNTSPKSGKILCTLDCGKGKRLLIHDLCVVTQLLSDTT